MDDTRHTLNELLVDLFNYILLIEEKKSPRSGSKAVHDRGTYSGSNRKE